MSRYRDAMQWLAFLIVLVPCLWLPLATPAFGQAGKGGFEPDCGSDPACAAWREFRRSHPFPVQTIAAKRAGNRLVLIFTEPALPRGVLEPLLKSAFASDRPSIQTRRWLIGEDGWLEDVLLAVDAGSSSAAAASFLDDPLLRDRLALVAERMWGTAFGLHVEPVASNFAARARARAPNLDPRVGELSAWLGDAQLKWRAIGSDTVGRAFGELPRAGTASAYASDDNQLTLLLLSRADVELAQRAPQEFADRWRAAFRTFAVASDAVLGAAWKDDDRSLAFVGRLRRVPVDVIAPLRFETFALLARAATGELAQSYERRTPLAGKMLTGRHAGFDWAPIYLSRPLIDTEFGALLNITDQMLKSWSMAGHIDYLYFDYPLRPTGNRFAFGAEPLLSIVERETGSEQVLFNWNTSGSAAVVARGGFNVLTPTLTGALPITYGAESSPGSGMKFGAQVASLLKHERNAYAYFSNLRDPNLARVVSYTVVYQAFQAYAGHGGRQGGVFEPIVEREAAMKALTSELVKALDELERPDAARRMVDSEIRMMERRQGRKIEAAAGQRERAAAQMQVGLDRIARLIRSIQSSDARYADRHALAALLVDSRSAQRAVVAALVAREQAFHRDVQAYNAAVTLRRSPPVSRESLEARQRELEGDEKRLRTLWAKVAQLHGLLGEPLSLLCDLDRVRKQYVAANLAAPAGWIKTPSVVISRAAGAMEVTGGHNLDARALRIEVDAAATEATVVERDGIRVLKVPNAQADEASARANDLARQIEHGKADLGTVRKLLAEQKAPVMARPRPVALDTQGPADWRMIGGHGGGGRLADESLRRELLSLYDRLGTPFAGMAWREPSGDFLLLSRVDGKPDCCVRVRDLATFRERLTAWKGKGDIALVEFEPAQADALARNLEGRNDRALLEAVGGGGGREPPKGTYSFVTGNGGDKPPGGSTGRSSGSGRPEGGSGGSGRGEPPAGGRSPDDPLMIAMTVQHGSVQEAHLVLSKPRAFGPAGDPLTGKAAEMELGMQTGGMSLRPFDALKWSRARDGEPVVFKLRFLEVDPASPTLEARVVAGVEPSRATVGIGIVREAIDAAREQAPRQSLFDLQTSIKKIVARHPEAASVKRLLAQVAETRLGFLMSQAPSAGEYGQGS